MKAMIKTSYYNNQRLPLVIEPVNNAHANVSALIEYLNKQNMEMKNELLKHGAILFRGFNLSGAEDFSNCVKACQLGGFFEYVGGVAPRKKLAEGVFTSTEASARQSIPAHNEMSYASQFPEHIFFYCHQAPVVKGATPLVDGRRLYQEIDSKLREKLEKQGVVYKRFFYGKSRKMDFLAKFSPFFMSWSQSFGTEDRQKIEEKLKQQGIGYEWTKKLEGLYTYAKLPAFRKHPATGEMVWFNQIISFNDYYNSYQSALGPYWTWLLRYFLLTAKHLPNTTLFGNEERIKKTDVKNIWASVKKHTVIVPWKAGDFMVIDNYLVLHARQPFKGKRLIMASLTKQQKE